MLLIEGKDTNRRSFFFLVKVTLMTRRFLALSGLGMTADQSERRPVIPNEVRNLLMK